MGYNRLAKLSANRIEETEWRDDVEAPDDWVAKLDQRPTTARMGIS